MISFVRLYTRQFHVTSKVFLRKIAPKASSKDHNHEFPKSNLEALSSCQSSCPDYLGIESDENVITVNPQKHRVEQPKVSEASEKFYRASYGIVRLDAENKLKYHGQYKNKIDFTFPHSSCESVKVSKILQTSSYKNKIFQDQPLKDSQRVSAVDTLNKEDDVTSSFKKMETDVNYIDECYFRTSETNNLTQNKTQQPTPEELNFLEKDYFEMLVQSKNSSLVQSSNIYNNFEQKFDPAFYNKDQAEELNYLDSEAIDTSENLLVKQNSAECSNLKKVDSHVRSINQSANLDEYYTNSENHPLEINISNYNDNEKELNTVCNLKDHNELPRNNNLTATVDELNFIDKSFYENSSLPNVQNSTYHEDLVKAPSHCIENNNEDIYNQFSEQNHYSKSKSHNKVLKSKFNDNNVHELKELNQNKTIEDDFKKLSSFNTQKRNIISHENSETTAKDSNVTNMLHNETVKSFTKANKFKFSKLNSQGPSQDNEVSTAHDFVQKLREEQKVPSQITTDSVGKRTGEEKFDSKGFRILKNQVPNLSYFTHDEIFNILKKNIVYSDDDLVVLNKPYNLVIHESKSTKEPCLSTFLDGLAKEIDKESTNPKLLTVHRLDKDTTGCILLARNETMAMHLKALFAQRKIVKKYWIVTVGVPDPPEGVIDIPISEGSINDRRRMVLHPKLPSDIPYRSHSDKGKPAVSSYKVISESGSAAIVEVFPKTGVKHQIRVHFGFGLGCPILGDHKYSHLDKLVPQKLPSDMLQRLHVRQSKVRHIPMHIHAKSVGIPQYFDDKRDLFVNIPIPDYFKMNLKRLKFRKKDMIH